MNGDVKRIILEMLEESIDDVLKDDGFTRRENSLVYQKKIGTTKQKIAMNVNSYYATFAQIYPFFSVDFPRINETAKKMTENDPILNRVIGNMKNTIHQPVQLYSKSERWILVRGRECDNFAPQISSFLKTHTLPMLKDIEYEDDLIALYEKQDKRILMGDVQYIYVASAYVLKKDYAKALNVLESQLNAITHRQHITVFHYIESLL